MTASIRSLRSLKLVPPPPPPPPPPARATTLTAPPSRKLYQDDVFHHDNWAHQAPYAPHAQLRIEEETRDEPECRPSASDELFSVARDEARHWKTSTPPRIPQPRKDEAMAAYSSEKRSSYHRSPSPATTPEKEDAPMKYAGRRSTRGSPSPLRTQDRDDQHLKDLKAHSQSGDPIDMEIGVNYGSQQCRSSSSKPRSSGCNHKISLVGMSKVYSRALIPPIVYHNTTANLWIVTINTNSMVDHRIIGPKIHADDKIANNPAKVYSFREEKEARACAYAIAPPFMVPFDQCKECMLCAKTFTLYKRPRHCRNCGIVICNTYGCCTTWPKKMIPESFNFKKESNVNICTSCDVLAKRFHNALLLGQYGAAMELYLTGNINLRVPFAFKGRSDNEIMLPIHCAIQGKSLELLRWLVDVQYCPIHDTSSINDENGGVISSIRGTIKSLASNTKKKYVYVPTLKTSKGRSVLDIGMASHNVGILRYLINEKGVSVYEVEDLEVALGAVEALAKTGNSGQDSFTGNNATQDSDKGQAGNHDDEEYVTARRSSNTKRDIP
ncbi:hypothetical protein ACHAXA_010046 [Cyclostephanos tholiformis]|uniref:FYVE-type domain-containing protein n=1 Tax=Cyclostephanos tholiformis TaxID=382380 RepID=A0ABD3R9C0_9STRA